MNKHRIFSVVLCTILFVLPCITAFAGPVYARNTGIVIPGDKNAYGPSTYFKRPSGTSSQRWHCYLQQMDYDVDIGGGYPYEGNDIAVYVYSRTVSKQVSGKHVMTGIGASHNETAGYTFNSYAPLSKSKGEYKIVACKNNSSTRDVTECGLYCLFDWQPY